MVQVGKGAWEAEFWWSVPVCSGSFDLLKATISALPTLLPLLQTLHFTENDSLSPLSDLFPAHDKRCPCTMCIVVCCPPALNMVKQELQPRRGRPATRMCLWEAAIGQIPLVPMQIVAPVESAHFLPSPAAGIRGLHCPRPIQPPEAENPTFHTTSKDTGNGK